MSYRPDLHFLNRVDVGENESGAWARLWYMHRDAYRGFRGERADVRYFDTVDDRTSFLIEVAVEASCREASR